MKQQKVEHKIKKLIECGLSFCEIDSYLKTQNIYINDLKKTTNKIDKKINKEIIINNKDYDINKTIRSIYKNTEKRALIKKYDFNLNTEFLKNLFIKQDGCCAVTGIKFNLVDKTHYRIRPFFPSLDRINNSEGYLKKNVRFVCVAVNIALFDFGLQIFDYIVKKRAEKLYKKHITIESEDADIKELDNKKTTPSIDIPKRMTRGGVCSAFSLDPCWFLIREKYGLEVPKPEEIIRNKKKPYKYVYTKEVVENFFKENKDALLFNPKLFLKQIKSLPREQKYPAGLPDNGDRYNNLQPDVTETHGSTTADN